MRPTLAALAVLLRGDEVLLVRRRNEPDAGLWGYPGGHVDPGEAVRDAATRELREETGVEAQAVDVIDALDVIRRDAAGDLKFHFVLVAVRCRLVAGEPVAGDDVSAAEWVPVADVLAHARPISAEVDNLLRKAIG